MQSYSERAHGAILTELLPHDASVYAKCYKVFAAICSYLYKNWVFPRSLELELSYSILAHLYGKQFF